MLETLYSEFRKQSPKVTGGLVRMREETFRDAAVPAKHKILAAFPVSDGRREMSARKILVQVASRMGVVFTGLCCLGLTSFLGFLTAVGAGFLINDLFLIPLFILFLGMSLLGLRRGKVCHGNRNPLLLGILFSLSALILLPFIPLMAYVSLTGLTTVYIWDFYLLWCCKRNYTLIRQGP